MSVRGSFQLRPSREGGLRKSLLLPKQKNQSPGILLNERGGTARNSRRSIQFDANEQIANLKKQKRLLGSTGLTDFSSPTAYRFAPQVEQGKFKFQQIDQLMQDDPAYAEPEFIKQHREEFERFLVGNRPDLNRNEYHEEEYMQLNAPLMKTFSPISTYHVQKRCPRYIRNFGSSVPQIPHQEFASTTILVQDYKNGETHSPQKFQMPTIDNRSCFKNGTQLYRPTGGNILLSSQSSLMQSYTKLLMPIIDKEKLRQELNQLVAYRQRKLQILQKLEADLSQIKFTTSQASAFAPSLTYRQTAPTSPKNKVCCSSPGDVKSPTRLLMYSSSMGSQKKSLGMTISNMETFSLDKGFRNAINLDQKQAAYSRKSQFGQNSQEIQEQNKNVQATTMPDDFSIVDLEFRKVQLQMKIRVKEREMDECMHENQTLSHHLAKEKHQNLLNKKSFNELLPTFEDYEAMGYRFQHIEALNYFRKFVAEHTLKEKLEELTTSHEDHRFEISKLLDQLRNESEQLHVVSMQLQSREQDLEEMRLEIRQTRNKTANLGNIKKKWVGFLETRHKEYRIVRILRIFFLIAKLKEDQSFNGDGGSGSVFQSIEENKAKKSSTASDKSLQIDDTQEEDQRTQIFTELQQLLVKFTQTKEIRAFCNQVLMAEMPDLVKFFEQDAIFEEQYKEVEGKLNESEVITIYNHSQFAIASLQGTHDNLMYNKEKKKAQILELKGLGGVLSTHKEVLVDYLACAQIAERNELDLTVEDMVKMREIQTKYLCQSKQTLIFLIPQVHSLLAHTHQQVTLLESLIKGKIHSENMQSVVGSFLIGALARPTMNEIQIALVEDANNDVMGVGDNDDLHSSNLSSLGGQHHKTNENKQFDMDNQPYQKSMTQKPPDQHVLEMGPATTQNKKNIVGKKLHTAITLTSKAIKVSKRHSQKPYERPASSFVPAKPNIDFNDQNQVEVYLQQETLDCLELLSKLGVFMKKCETAITKLQKDMNCGNPIEIDYQHYERQFHETHYMKTLAINTLMQKDRFSNSSRTTPFGGQVASIGSSHITSPQSVHFHSDVNLVKDRNNHLQTQQSSVANRLTEAGDDNIPMERKSLKTQGGSNGAYTSRGGTSGGGGNLMNSNIEQRGLYQGSELMNDRFKRVRNLQQFECRERQFLRQFRKRIHESYFTNN